MVSEAAARVAASEPGAAPTTITPRVPVVAVTGTNGKTTTSRMIAHIGRADGRLVGWSNTDGIYIDGELVEAGDYSGPSGPGGCWRTRRCELAVTETARGGILLKGIGLTRNDVSVVTNVSADHLGLQGIDTLDQLAEVKGVVPHITRKDGWAVLNGDDPRVFAMRGDDQGAALGVLPRPGLTGDPRGARPTAAGPRRSSTAGSPCSLPNRDPDPLVELVDVPMTLAGLSRFNVENSLAAASAALAVGIPRERGDRGAAHVPPRRRAQPGPDELLLPARARSSVVMDLAHNEAGLEALLEIMNGVRRPGCRLLLGLGAVGDRTDDLIELLGEIGARDSDVIAIGHKKQYLRGRTTEELEGLHARRSRAGRRHRRAGVRHRGGLPRRPGRPGEARRRGRADVPRGAAGGLRLDRRARRYAGQPGDAAREGEGRAGGLTQIGPDGSATIGPSVRPRPA